MNRLFTPALQRIILGALFFLFITSGSVSGGGFAIIEQSVSGLGNAFAGGAASAEDAATIFFNPAGLIRISGAQYIGASHIIVPTAEFKNRGSTHILQGVTGVPLLGVNGGDAGAAAAVPNLYFSRQMNDRVAIGLGIYAPFGLETDYDSNWVGRYHAIDSELTTVNLNPTMAVAVNDHVSIGAGINLQFIDTKLSNAIDFGTLDAVGAFAPLGIPAGGLGLIPQGSDGFIELEGDNWGWGFNVGLLYEFIESTRLGIAYRSRIRHRLEGNADFSNVPSGLAPTALFKDGDVKADVNLPDSLSVSVFHRINSAWAIMADITWTNWSLFDELRVVFDNPAQADAVTTVRWDDSFRYSLGLSFRPNDDWIFRAGGAYDETPIPGAQYRTPRIPGEDRIWVATGFGYKISRMFSIDVGYAHLFIDEPNIRKRPVGEDEFRGGLTGLYDADVDIASAQIIVSF